MSNDIFLRELEKFGQESNIPGVWSINNVLVEIVPNKIGKANYEILMIASENKGKGYGTKVMNIITELADKNDINLNLVAMPLFEQSPENTKRLIKWYASFGFDFEEMEIQENWSECGLKMRRKPLPVPNQKDIDYLFPVENINNFKGNFI